MMSKKSKFRFRGNGSRRRGAICHLVSPNHIEYAPAFGIQFPEIAKTHVLAIQFTENSGWIPIDARVEEATVEDYDAVYVPESAWNPDQLRANPAVLSFLQKFQATGKPLGALCHGSQVFLCAKLIKGRKATGYRPIMEDMTNAGATVLDQPVVVDERNHQPLYLQNPAVCRCHCRST
jgi:protease I